MNKRPELYKLCLKVEKLYKKTKKATSEAFDEAVELNKTSRTSWSAAGEREFGKNTYLIKEERSSQLKNLLTDLKKALIQPRPQKIIVPCFVNLKYTWPEEVTKKFYIVSSTVHLAGFNIISSDSVVGKSLLNKSASDNFKYKVGDIVFDGTVVAIS